MKGFVFHTLLLCDSAFQDINKKWNVIGIYPGSLNVSSFPAELRLALYIEMSAPEDVDFSIDVILGKKKFAEIQGKYTLDYFENAPMVGVLSMSGIAIGVDQPTILKLVAHIAGSRPRTILTKYITQA